MRLTNLALAMEPMEIQGKIVDVLRGSIFPGTITIEDGKIRQISKLQHSTGPYIIPGFIDAHVHIESSMLVPSEFARLAVTHGTVATVSDPHEIANVLGVEGVEYMIDDLHGVEFKCYFGAPSCVPATNFETAGATIDSEQVDYLLSKPEIHYLAEMMNYPGVLNRDPEVLAKIGAAVKYNKPVDGHAPGLMGNDAKLYQAAGISTDHECSTREEALGKLALGMKILIREGSAARNFEALIPLLSKYHENIMFCSDDLHPDNLVKGHVNLLVKRAVNLGIDPMVVMRVASKNPIDHYRLNVGLLQEEDPADFILVDNLKDFNVLQTYVDGQHVAAHGKSLIKKKPSKKPNQFNTGLKTPDDFKVTADGSKIRVIVAEDGQLFTKSELLPVTKEKGLAVPNLEHDILKIAVVNRYQDVPPKVGFIKGFGLKEGAIASSVAHDSHNIIAVGVDDHWICKAVNQVITLKGGIVAMSQNASEVIHLPIAGLMSDVDGYTIAEQYTRIDALAKKMGSNFQSPFMTLSFMALLVIPDLKLGDQGLFSGASFEFVPVFED